MSLTTIVESPVFQVAKLMSIIMLAVGFIIESTIPEEVAKALMIPLIGVVLVLNVLDFGTRMKRS
jgi:hypothetical protein